MKVLALMLVILILFAFLLKYKSNLRGGEYRTFKFEKSNVSYTPSISQLELHSSSKASLNKLRKRTVDSLILQCANSLRRRAAAKFEGKKAYISVMNEAHLISDAYMDLLALILADVQIDYAFACCEWHGDEFKAELNSLMTFYDDEHSISFERGDTFKWLHAPYVNFAAYTPEDDSKELAKIERLLPSNIQTLNKEQLINCIYSMPEYYSSNRLLDVARAVNINNNLSKDVHLNVIFGLRAALTEFKKTKSKRMIHIYIEYSYDKEGAYELYSKIHLHTTVVLRYLLSKNVEDDDIYCYRFKYSKDGLSRDAYKLIEPVVIKTHRIYIYDECNYSIVQIPKTTTSFAYDEQLFISSKSHLYSIQVEHSEDGSSHKSNFVEFLARVISPFATLSELRTVFRHTSYLSEHQNTFQFRLKRESINIEDSVIYKAFGRKGSNFF